MRLGHPKSWKPDHVQRNMMVIYLRLQNRTLEQIGTILNIDKERVRNIEAIFNHWARIRLGTSLKHYRSLNARRENKKKTTISCSL